MDKSSNDGFTKGLVVVLVEGVVEELEIRAVAINGGSDTVKSKAIQERKKCKIEKTESEEFDKMEFFLIQAILLQVPIYIQ